MNVRIIRVDNHLCLSVNQWYVNRLYWSFHRRAEARPISSVATEIGAQGYQSQPIPAGSSPSTHSTDGEQSGRAGWDFRLVPKWKSGHRPENRRYPIAIALATELVLRDVIQA